MIIPKREDAFFLEREYFPLLEVTAEMGFSYRLLEYKNYNLCHYLPIDTFNIPGHFLGLDNIHEKITKIDLWRREKP